MDPQCVYVATCLEFKHPENNKPLIKIGLSKVGVPERMQTLSSSGVPGTYICIFYFECEDCHKVESTLHSIFADLRYKNEKEFFTVSPESVAKALEAIPGVLYRYEDLPEQTSRKKRRKKRQNEPPDDKKSKIIRMFENRWNQKQISEKLKISTYHVGKTVRSYLNSKNPTQG